MSNSACAEGYDSLAQHREDSTTFMVAKVVRTNYDIVFLLLLFYCIIITYYDRLTIPYYYEAKIV